MEKKEEKKVSQIKGIVLDGIFHERVKTTSSAVDCVGCSLVDLCAGTGMPCDLFDRTYAGYHFEARGVVKVGGLDDDR